MGCAVEQPRAHRWPDWSRASASVLRALGGNRASGGGEAGRHASPYDDLLPTCRSGYTPKTIPTPIRQDEVDRTSEALQSRRLGLPLTVGSGNLGTIGDVPTSIAFD